MLLGAGRAVDGDGVVKVFDCSGAVVGDPDGHLHRAALGYYLGPEVVGRQGIVVEFSIELHLQGQVTLAFLGIVGPSASLGHEEAALDVAIGHAGGVLAIVGIGRPHGEGVAHIYAFGRYHIGLVERDVVLLAQAF